MRQVAKERSRWHRLRKGDFWCISYSRMSYHAWTSTACLSILLNIPLVIVIIARNTMYSNSEWNEKAGLRVEYQVYFLLLGFRPSPSWFCDEATQSSIGLSSARIFANACALIFSGTFSQYISSFFPTTTSTSRGRNFDWDADGAPQLSKALLWTNLPPAKWLTIAWA